MAEPKRFNRKASSEDPAPTKDLTYSEPTKYSKKRQVHTTPMTRVVHFARAGGKTMKSILMDLGLFVLFALIASLVTVYLCDEYDVFWDIHLSLVVVPIVFPLAFSINASYQRREKVLDEFALFMSSACEFYFCHRDWSRGTNLPPDHSEEVRKLTRALLDSIIRYCRHRTPANRFGKLRKFYRILHRLALKNTAVMRSDLPANSPLVTRLIHYHHEMQMAFERLRNVREYTTPRSIRYYYKFFVFLAPCLLAPYFVFMARDVDGDPVTNSSWGAYYAAVVTCILFGALQAVNDGLDDPFDGFGEDDVHLERIAAWPTFALFRNIKSMPMTQVMMRKYGIHSRPYKGVSSCTETSSADEDEAECWPDGTTQVGPVRQHRVELSPALSPYPKRKGGKSRDLTKAFLGLRAGHGLSPKPDRKTPISPSDKGRPHSQPQPAAGKERRRRRRDRADHAGSGSVSPAVHHVRTAPASVDGSPGVTATARRHTDDSLTIELHPGTAHSPQSIKDVYIISRERADSSGSHVSLSNQSHLHQDALAGYRVLELQGSPSQTLFLSANASKVHDNASGAPSPQHSGPKDPVDTSTPHPDTIVVDAGLLNPATAQKPRQPASSSSLITADNGSAQPAHHHHQRQHQRAPVTAAAPGSGGRHSRGSLRSQGSDLAPHEEVEEEIEEQYHMRDASSTPGGEPEAKRVKGGTDSAEHLQAESTTLPSIDVNSVHESRHVGNAPASGHGAGVNDGDDNMFDDDAVSELSDADDESEDYPEADATGGAADGSFLATPAAAVDAMHRRSLSLGVDADERGSIMNRSFETSSASPMRGDDGAGPSSQGSNISIGSLSTSKRGAFVPVKKKKFDPAFSSAPPEMQPLTQPRERRRSSGSVGRKSKSEGIFLDMQQTGEPEIDEAEEEDDAEYRQGDDFDLEKFKELYDVDYETAIVCSLLPRKNAALRASVRDRLRGKRVRDGLSPTPTPPDAEKEDGSSPQPRRAEHASDSDSEEQSSRDSPVSGTNSSRPNRKGHRVSFHEAANNVILQQGVLRRMSGSFFTAPSTGHEYVAFDMGVPGRLQEVNDSPSPQASGSESAGKSSKASN